MRSFAILATAACLAAAPPATAGVVINVYESGNDVVASGSGTVNTAGLSRIGIAINNVGVQPGSGFLIIGGKMNTTYSGFTGPADFESVRGALENIEKFTATLSQNSDKIDRTLSNIEKFTAALSGNSDNIDKTLANIERFTGALGRNSDRIDRIAQGLEGLTGGPDGKGGDINEAARSIKTLADNLDKRTEELTGDIARLARTGTRTLTTIDKAAKNFDANPSRIIWGGDPPDADKKPKSLPTPVMRR